MNNHVEGTVTLTLAQVDALRDDAKKAREESLRKDSIIKTMEDNQRQVVKKIGHYVIDLNNLIDSEYKNKPSNFTFGFKTSRGQYTYIDRHELYDLINTLLKEGNLKIREDFTTSYVNFEDVREELRISLEAKMDEKYRKDIADAKVQRETLDSQLARKTAHHLEEIENLKSAQETEKRQFEKIISEWKEKYNLLEEDKKIQSELDRKEEENKKLLLTIQQLKDNIEKIKNHWWKLWK